MKPLVIVVIGGGAAGFFGAIAAAQANPKAQVTLLEASRHPLNKVLISGGGRCNVTHACFEPSGLVQNYPRGGKALLGAFTRFQAKDTVAWFANRGVPLKTEADGRMFPITDSSETIANCLMKTAKTAGVDLRTGEAVASINAVGDRFKIALKSGENLECDRLLLATGSNPVGYRLAKDLGHTVEPPVPSLFTFNIRDENFRELAGVSVESARLSLTVPDKPAIEQLGPILITHWGLSGPAVLKLSAWAARALHSNNYKATLHINWLPHLKADAVRQQILAVKDEWGKRAMSLHRGVDLPHRLWRYIISRIGIAPEMRWAELPSKKLNLLVQELTRGQFLIDGKGVFKEEFVTCGGVNLKEINFKTMESKLVPGLYFAGEILDIDGITGGFNFQSAWTTGYLAGQAIASIIE
ncbi:MULTISPECIES: BaiN/RdsA family NAD(P)/FAD-dependent oxidoreductase [Nostocales]|uniref:Flavoprotein n=3 Tax=Nostocales TaxID=1161 RepID=A0A0C1R932_9CYAN|nr:NAD(P)/FAD-dependent oxidoreductase [Tolypothrix bouteillei]KAF3891333.1 NAD(P)/FAD-dependent oxidoreductase [Tolypothrix bouteillei VB521301]